MGGQFSTVRWDRVLLDICTQYDYLGAGAILKVVNRDTVTENLQRIFAWADVKHVAIFSSVECHRISEPMNGFPLHCIDGTPGQEKLDYTLLSPWTSVENDNYLSLPPDIRKKYRQLIFRKRSREVLSNPKADRFLTQLETSEMIIFGVGLERSIKSLALGLLARNKPVWVVSDACGYWSAADADLSLRQLAAKGIRLVTTEELVTAPDPVRKRSFLQMEEDENDRHDEPQPDSRRRRSRISK